MEQQIQSERAVEKLGGISIGPALDGFSVFIVGGAVRDALRGETPTDIDFMAVPQPGRVSGNPEDTLRKCEAITPVEPSSAFPVFLDGEGREVALPRKDKSTGESHKDIRASVISPDVPVARAVETDLRRRDLTINAMAFDLRAGELIDPFDGAEDLWQGVLRPVSDAFDEDPIRVLRMARFAATFKFSVPEENLEAPREGASAIKAEPGERIAIELRKTLKRAEKAGMFIRWLDTFNAIRFAFPEFVMEDIEEIATRLDALDSKPARLAAIGVSLRGTTVERFIERLGLTSSESKTVKVGAKGMNEAIEAGAINDPDEGARAAMDAADLVDDRGIDMTSEDLMAVAEVISEDQPFNAKRGETRIAGIRQAREDIDAEKMFTRLGIEPSDLNNSEIEIDGIEFGRRLRSARQALVAAGERLD